MSKEFKVKGLARFADVRFSFTRILFLLSSLKLDSFSSLMLNVFARAVVDARRKRLQASIYISLFFPLL